ncbi:MAG: hypothetical protein IJX51_02750 [Clostridia bacterium]|nr:hypothetical protein [Clostridia bacterium]
MPDNRLCSNPHGRENICIDTYRILDSCRDKDCFENVKVYLTDFGEEIIERTSTIRATCSKIVSAYIDVSEVPFNRGFYQLDIKIYVKISFEACLSQGNIQEFEGIAVVEKKVVLFGSEGNVNIFKSEPGKSGFCPEISCDCTRTNNLPIAVIETVDPVVLNVKVVEPHVFPCCCCCCLDDIPEYVTNSVHGKLCEREDKTLVVSLGFFSVVRIERPAQLLINAVESCIPEKECITAQENDPCTLFKSMAFPVDEFCPPMLNKFGNGCSHQPDNHGKGSCGCH